MADYRDFTSLNILCFRRGKKQFHFLFFSFASVVYPFLKLQMSKVTKSAFQKVRIGQPDHGRTGHFENEIGFFQESLMKNDLVRACYLGFDWSGWIALIKSEILITTEMALPVSSVERALSFTKWTILSESANQQISLKIVRLQEIANGRNLNHVHGLNIDSLTWLS